MKRHEDKHAIKKTLPTKINVVENKVIKILGYLDPNFLKYKSTQINNLRNGKLLKY